jgi:hypothetical protein
MAARICRMVRGGAFGGVDGAELAVAEALGAAVLGWVDPLAGVVGVVGVVLGPPPDVHPVSATTITAVATPMDLTRPLSQPVGAAARWWRPSPGHSYRA